MVGVTLKQVRKNYGNMEVLHGIDLDIEPGEFIAFVGPSGCGKSTLLRSIAGLEDVSSGELYIDGQLMNYVPPSKRGIAMVFQSYALYPHMTVFENMAFGMRIAKINKTEVNRRVRQAADILQLTDYLDRYPKALSGGQRQRVAIGRAIVRDPKVFLFDEPLSNLDAALRVATRIEIAKLKQSMPDTTMIYVTHDQVEAMTLADRIVVLRGGHIEQIGTPLDLYRRPANLFVARFIGSPAMNIVPVTIEAAGEQTTVTLASGKNLTLRAATAPSLKDAPVQFGVRPEDLHLAAGSGLFEGRIALIEQLGEVQMVYVDVDMIATPIIAKLPGTEVLHVGDVIRLDTDPQRSHMFDSDGVSLV
jgi:multiple sugar transport system ATP-binding protein/alpha-glucoside transport system ATP-binding protein